MRTSFMAALAALLMQGSNKTAQSIRVLSAVRAPMPAFFQINHRPPRGWRHQQSVARHREIMRRRRRNA